MGFTAADSAALEAAVLGGGRPVTVRETGLCSFSNIAGTQTWLLEGVFNAVAGSTANASISVMPHDGTLPSVLGIVLTLPRNGGTITGADEGANVTLGAIEQWLSGRGTRKHFSVSFVLPTPGTNLDWELSVDPVVAAANPATPIEFEMLRLTRPHAAILD